jgi:hypothetical protein
MATLLSEIENEAALFLSAIEYVEVSGPASPAVAVADTPVPLHAAVLHNATTSPRKEGLPAEVGGVR